MLKYLLYIYILVEVIISIKNQVSYRPGDKEIYSMIAADSPFFLDYSDYIVKNKDKYPEIANF